MKPVLDERKCPMQGQICQAIPACPEHAITYVAEPASRFGGRIVINYEPCNGCEACASACCGSAIDLVQ